MMQARKLLIQVYLDIPWIPYAGNSVREASAVKHGILSDLFANIGFSTDVKGLPTVMKTVQSPLLSPANAGESCVAVRLLCNFSSRGMDNDALASMEARQGDFIPRCRVHSSKAKIRSLRLVSVSA